MKIKLTLLIIVVSIFSFTTIAQTNIVVAGKEAGNSSVNMSYTVGQTFMTNSPYFIIGDYIGGKNGGGLGIDDQLSVSDRIKVSIYPNPTKGIFYMEVRNQDSYLDWSFQIVNLNGAKLMAHPIKEQKTSIDISHLSKGVYLLVIYHKNNVQKIVKVILS